LGVLVSRCQVVKSLKIIIIFRSLARASLLRVDALSGSENDPLVVIVEIETTMSKSQITSSSSCRKNPTLFLKNLKIKLKEINLNLYEAN